MTSIDRVHYTSQDFDDETPKNTAANIIGEITDRFPKVQLTRSRKSSRKQVTLRASVLAPKTNYYTAMKGGKKERAGEIHEIVHTPPKNLGGCHIGSPSKRESDLATRIMGKALVEIMEKARTERVSDKR